MSKLLMPAEITEPLTPDEMTVQRDNLRFGIEQLQRSHEAIRDLIADLNRETDQVAESTEVVISSARLILADALLRAQPTDAEIALAAYAEARVSGPSR